jgi:hypothetical protein
MKLETRGISDVRRRGLIAAGAALVTVALANLMAKPTAAGHSQVDPDVLNLGQENKANKNTSIVGEVGGTLFSVRNETKDQYSTAVNCSTQSGTGVYGVTYRSGHGIQGYALFADPDQKETLDLRRQRPATRPPPRT